MKVDEALINKLARLSRLSFEPEEKISIQQDLEKMISFVEKLQEVNTDAVAPLTHLAVSKNIMREDESVQGLSQADALKNSPESGKGFFMVPKVIKK